MLQCAERIGRDEHSLLAAAFPAGAPAWLRTSPAVILLGPVRLQDVQIVPADAETGTNDVASAVRRAACPDATSSS